MKHVVTNIRNLKCNPNDVITLINNLCQPDVGCDEKVWNQHKRDQYQLLNRVPEPSMQYYRRSATTTKRGIILLQ